MQNDIFMKQFMAVTGSVWGVCNVQVAAKYYTIKK